MKTIEWILILFSQNIINCYYRKNCIKINNCKIIIYMHFRTCLTTRALQRWRRHQPYHIGLLVIVDPSFSIRKSDKSDKMKTIYWIVMRFSQTIIIYYYKQKITKINFCKIIIYISFRTCLAIRTLQRYARVVGRRRISATPTAANRLRWSSNRISRI
jgi:hypothetical protein